MIPILIKISQFVLVGMNTELQGVIEEYVQNNIPRKGEILWRILYQASLIYVYISLYNVQNIKRYMVWNKLMKF